MCSVGKLAGGALGGALGGGSAWKSAALGGLTGLAIDKLSSKKKKPTSDTPAMGGA